MDNSILGLSIPHWGEIGISLLIILLVIVLGRWVNKVILGRGIKRLTRNTKTTLDDALYDSLHAPLYWLAVVFTFDIAIQRLSFVPESWNSIIREVFYVVYLLVVVGIVWRFTSNLFTWYGREMSAKTKTDLDDQLMPFFRRVALIIIGLIALITLLGHFEVEVGAMVTTLGIGSLAIALAAQATLSDTISGFVIMIDRPFRIGDRIQIQDLNTWGDVVDIGLRSSHIRTRDNRMVIVPNSVIAKSLVVNYAYPDSQYRIQVHVGVAYGTDLELARRTIIGAVETVEGVLDDHPVEALFLEFGDSALIFRVRWWINSYVDTRRMFDKVNTAIYNALNEAGVEIPFPQLVVRKAELEEQTG